MYCGRSKEEEEEEEDEEVVGHNRSANVNTVTKRGVIISQNQRQLRPTIE
jgi:hypothetical protein